MSGRERGRPREFDVERALDKAIEVFWRHGFEGASLSDLTSAMGINRPSLYAAFGNKEDLFRRAVQRYAEVDMAYVRDALAEPTAARVTDTLLRRNAEAITRPDRPAGCLSIQGGTACGTGNEGAARFLAESRLAGERLLAERFEQAVGEGDLPAHADPATLARFVMVVAEGNSVHAAAGVPRAQLLQVAEVALSTFLAANGRTVP
jgi:AcrR family transcriptional regulator